MPLDSAHFRNIHSIRICLLNIEIIRTTTAEHWELSRDWAAGKQIFPSRSHAASLPFHPLPDDRLQMSGHLLQRHRSCVNHQGVFRGAQRGTGAIHIPLVA